MSRVGLARCQNLVLLLRSARQTRDLDEGVQTGLESLRREIQATNRWDARVARQAVFHFAGPDGLRGVGARVYDARGARLQAALRAIANRGAIGAVQLEVIRHRNARHRSDLVRLRHPQPEFRPLDLLA